MPSTRQRVRVAATLLVAATALFAVTATRADAAPSPTVTPTVSPTPTPAGPGAPTDLRVTAVTPGSVTLTWTAAAGAVDSYSVNYIQAFNDVYWTQPVGNVTTATITSYIQGTGQYRFSVVARDAAGRTSASSNFITVVTPAGTTGDVTPPSAPTGLTVVDASTTGAILTWTASTDDVGVRGYNVYEWDGWYSSKLLGPAYTTTYVAPFQGTTPTGMRYYYVRAFDVAGNLSIASGTVSAPAPTSPPPPTDPPTNPPTTPTSPPPPTDPPTPPTSSPPKPTCKITYRTTSQWSGGFVAEVSVTNTGTAPVDGWVLTFPFGGDQKIISTWHATFTQEAANVTLTAAQWNKTIAPGATVTAGLIGRFTTSNTPPAYAALNGAACSLV